MMNNWISNWDPAKLSEVIHGPRCREDPGRLASDWGERRGTELPPGTERPKLFGYLGYMYARR